MCSCFVISSPAINQRRSHPFSAVFKPVWELVGLGLGQTCIGPGPLSSEDQSFGLSAPGACLSLAQRDSKRRLENWNWVDDAELDRS